MRPPLTDRSFRTEPSLEDASVNFVAPFDSSLIEARYVRRVPEYFICYLSSHNGCDKACRFCHLTQTGQTAMVPAHYADYVSQARQVLQHYDSLGAPAETVNYNFMARGEPFENPLILTNWRRLRGALEMMSNTRGLEARYNLSTIMPATLGARPLRDILGPEPHGTSVYYSLYSMRPEFRKRWLPKAMDPYAALSRLAEWQRDTGGEVVLHGAFIAGQNDDRETVAEILDVVDSLQLRTRFNLVRYNPYSPAQGVESPEAVIQARFQQIADALGDPRSRIVPRVGFDVKASCGMFVEA